MRSNFHESFEQTDVAPPPERSTGFVFAGVAAVAAAIFYRDPGVAATCLALSAAFALTAWLKPELLRGLNILWFRFGLLLHRVVNPLVMLLVFAVAIVPMGLLMQAFRDPLRKRRARDGETYWVPYERPEGAPNSMQNQF